MKTTKYNFTEKQLFLYSNWILKNKRTYQACVNHFKLDIDIETLRLKLIKYNPELKNLRKNKNLIFESNFKNYSKKFKKITSEKSAYWLGFLMADGNIDKKRERISITLGEKDYCHLVKLSNFLNVKNKIHKRVRQGKTKLIISYSTSTNNKFDFKDLVNLNLTPNKTETGKFINLKKVPLYLHSHFWRGYFDGDGHISKKQKNFQLCLNEEGKEYFINYLNKLGIFHYNLKIEKTKKENFFYTIRLTVKNSYFCFNDLYKNSSVRLNRKYFIWLYIKNLNKTKK